MKKLLLTLALLFFGTQAYALNLSVDAFVTPDDVTIPHLEQLRTRAVNAVNNIDGNWIQKQTITEDKLTKNANVCYFRDEAFNDWVYYGCLPPTSASLVSITTVGVAYIGGNRIEKEATSHTYGASKWTWVELDHLGTYRYVEGNINDPDPAKASTQSMRIARVSSDGTTINHVRDDRILAISLESRQQDYVRYGMRMHVVTPDKIYIDPGVVYHGTTRIKKITTTSLDLDDAWIHGARAGGDYGFVVISDAGSIGLIDTAPTYFDTAGTTVGKKVYVDNGGTLYRTLGWFYMNASSNIDNDWGNVPESDVENRTVVSGDGSINVAAAAFADMAGMVSHFYSFGGPLKMTFNGTFEKDNVADTFIGFEIDNHTWYDVGQYMPTGGNVNYAMSLSYMRFVPQGEHEIQMRWLATAGTTYCMDSESGIDRLLIVEER